MKKLLILLAAALLSGCITKTAIHLPSPPYADIPGDYSLDDAKRDLCVVFEDGDITSGQALWDGFAVRAGRGQPCAVRLAWYYTLDESRVSLEYYAANKDNYPVMYIQDLSFDGKLFHLYWVEGGSEYTREYRYMKRFDGSMRQGALYSGYVRYVLLNDETVRSWEQIETQMLSSVWLPETGRIEFSTVYLKYIP